ncbi:MAG: hypothetical protein Rubg2KO_41010 [Rubricoccaceae bacterium]
MVSPLGVRDTEPDEGNSWDRLYLLSRAVQRARASGDDELAAALEEEWLALRARLLKGDADG